MIIFLRFFLAHIYTFVYLHIKNNKAARQIMITQFFPLDRKPRAFLHNESLVGSGHITTMHSLGQALVDQGFEVMHATGSRLAKAAHLDFGEMQVVDLPESRGCFYSGSVKTKNMKRIEMDFEWQKEYKNKLLKAYDSFSPDIVVTEFWPVRRGAYDFAMLELMNSIEEDRKERNINLFCLLRDYVHMSVTNSGSGGTDKEALKVLRKHYMNDDYPAILVRGIEDVLPLQESFSLGWKDKKHVAYAGYCVPENKSQSDIGKDEVLVSSGGGYMEYCHTTSEAAILAREHTALSSNVWRILMPNDTPEGKFKELQELAQKHSPDGKIIVEHNRKDFGQRLPNASLLITHAGNTIPEAIKAGTNAVVMPRVKPLMDTFNLSVRNAPKGEQLARAEAFARADLVKLALQEDVTDTAKFAQIIDEALELESAVNVENGFSGHKKAAAIISETQIALPPFQNRIEWESGSFLPMYTSYEN